MPLLYRAAVGLLPLAARVSVSSARETLRRPVGLLLLPVLLLLLMLQRRIVGGKRRWVICRLGSPTGCVMFVYVRDGSQRSESQPEQTQMSTLSVRKPTNRLLNATNVRFKCGLDVTMTVTCSDSDIPQRLISMKCFTSVRICSQ